MLFGDFCLFGVMQDRASALEFGTRRDEYQLDSYRSGRRSLTLSANDLQSDKLKGAVKSARVSSDNLYLFSIVGLLAYLLIARESRRFRLAVLGVMFVAAIAQSFVYPIY
jgi:hypothetical protein